MNRSQIFSVYNKAKSNKALETLDKARVNRALGYLLSKDQSWRTKYQPTVKSCRCPDSARNHICKHRIAIMIETKWQRENKVELKPKDTNVYQPTSDGSVKVIVQKVGTYDYHIFPTPEEFERYLHKHGFDGTVVRPGKQHGRRGYTIEHGLDEWME